MIFAANRPGFIKFLSPERKTELINHERECNPEDCSRCIFYYHVFENGVCVHGACSIDDGVYISDILTRHPDCPLNLQDVV